VIPPKSIRVHRPSRRQFLQLSSTLLLGTALRPISIFGRSTSSLPLVERAIFTMGSIVTIKAYHADEGLCGIAIDEAFHEMKIVDSLMSVFDERSELSLLNREGGKREITVDSRIIEITEHARQFYRRTGGAFDPTIEPLMALFGFRDEKQFHHCPSDQTIAATLESVGMNRVVTDSERSSMNFEHPRTQLDFGGIAVGYAIDRAVLALKARGIESAIVNHSGDIYAIGAPPDDDAWEIGITDPGATDAVITTVRIRNQALSTSGNYRNFIKEDGNIIGHILNPSTGHTASAILSGTVIASTALEADALSTGFFVLGVEQSRHVLRELSNVQFIAVRKHHGSEQLITIRS